MAGCKLNQTIFRPNNYNSKIDEYIKSLNTILGLRKRRNICYWFL